MSFLKGGGGGGVDGFPLVWGDQSPGLWVSMCPFRFKARNLN